jgi:phosphoribosylaminoimidazolecarboxamide formyltransferase/IMP cyclohydrolase
VTPAEAIEKIDIGGPALVRAAAKNHAHVGVVVDPDDYPVVLAHLRSERGLAAGTRAELAAKAFDHTASYDAQIAAWFEHGRDLPDSLTLSFRKIADLRYGENAHQAAAWYADDRRPAGLSSARQLGGKQLSYNNLVDTDAAWQMANDFADPCVAIVKHTNPAGLAVGATVADAYPRALAGDPVSAFGGIVAANRGVDADTARQIAEVFTEVVIAPFFSAEALAILGAKANLRLLAVEHQTDVGARAVRSIDGGLLVQDLDDLPEAPESWEAPTRAQPDKATLAELHFAWRVCKHVKSNAIVLTRDRATVGVGAGQMSRVDSVHLAVGKSDGRQRGAVLASDAFFPFRDGPDAALEAGVVAIVQPGGSKRDDDTIAACDEHGVPMVMTGRRHFRH